MGDSLRRHIRWVRNLNVRLLATLAAFGLSVSTADAFDVNFRTSGGDEALDARLQASSLVTAAKAEGTTEGQDIVAAAQSDYKRLIGVLYRAGYFGPTISIKVNGQEAADISPFAQIRTVSNVSIAVTPGNKFRFGQTQIAPITPETELPEEFAPAAAADLGAIEGAARAAVSGWRDRGHAKAKVSDQNISADHRNSELDVDVKVDPGPELAFGELIYKGQSAVRSERVREIADLPTGSRFDPEIVDEVSARLRRTETFRTVDLREAEEANPDDTLDMELALVDSAPRRIGAGAELESSEGLSLSAFWLHRNLLGGAEKLRFDAEIENIGGDSAGLNYRLGTIYSRPATFNSNTALVVGAEIKQEDEDLYFLRQIGASVGYKRIVSERLETSAALTTFHSHVRDNFGDRTFQAIGIRAGAKLDRRDVITNPTRGYFIQATAFPYAGFSETEPALFLEGDFRAYHGFGADNRLIAAGRIQVGSILGPSLRGTPPDLLFKSGGGGTVRGQPYQSGFVTVNGIESGGLSFLGISTEARIKITDTISTVAFFDGGFVGETSNIFGDGSFHSGAGIGVRYNTGFGPIRLDLGAPVSGNTGDGIQLYIGIGHAF